MSDTIEKTTFGIKQTLFNQMFPRRSNFNGCFVVVYFFLCSRKERPVTMNTNGNYNFTDKKSLKYWQISQKC